MPVVTFSRWFFVAHLLVFALPALAIAGDAPSDTLTGKELVGSWYQKTPQGCQHHLSLRLKLPDHPSPGLQCPHQSNTPSVTYP